MRTNRKDYINSNKIKTMAWLFSSKPRGLDQTGVIAEPVLDHLASNWNVWWNRSWLVASISLHCEKNKTKLGSPPPPPWPSSTLKKIKQSSCGFGLAQHKDRQNKWTYVDLQKTTWENVSWRGSSQRTSCLWGQMLGLAFLSRPGFLSADLDPSQWPPASTSAAWRRHPGPPSQRNRSFVWWVPSSPPPRDEDFWHEQSGSLARTRRCFRETARARSELCRGSASF